MAMPMLQDATFVCSLGWILYRIWQIYQKPVDELVDLLGLDIPPVPEVSLAGITAESVLLYWKPPGNHSASLKHTIQVNGIKVGEFGRGDKSIQVTGLKPGHYYNIRIIATNVANFSSLGPLIRLRTAPADPAAANGAPIMNDVAENNNPDEVEPASIRAAPSHFESPSGAVTHHIIREPSSSQNQARRTASGRRNSPATSGYEQGIRRSNRAGSSDEDEPEETIRQLTEKLDSLRREQQEMDRLISEEEQESKKSMADLAKERDHLRQVLKEKEEASSELRKHGNYLDKLNRTTQSKKAAKEKVLLQKRAERQKIKDDIVKWDREIGEMQRDAEEMAKETAGVIEAKDNEVAGIRKGIAEDQVFIKSLEEDIRVKGIQIKAMEKERETPGGDGDEEEERAKAEREKDEAWEVKAQAAQAHVSTLWHSVQQAEAESQRAQEHLTWWTARRVRDPSLFAPIPGLDYTSSTKSSRGRRTRQSNSRTNVAAFPGGGYPGGSMAFNNPSTISPPFSSASPFFNMSNGMTVAPTSEQIGMAQREADILAGVGAMSPTANDLLPSNLFRDEDIMSRRLNPGHDSLGSAGSDVYPKHGVSNVEAPYHLPHTPVSAGSRAGSIFSSPHDSLHNLHNYQTRTDSLLDSDRQSVSSTGVPFNPSVAAETNPLATSRIASLFSTTFSRQRGKSNSQEAPSLGTLKQGQSQSFPRNPDGDLDPIGTRRRRGSYGNWANPMAGLLNRSTAPAGSHTEDHDIITTRTGSGRRSRLNMFSSKYEPVEPSALAENPSSSRPSSMYSYDQLLGRASGDSHNFRWPGADNIPNRSSPLGTQWSTTGGPWSRAQSRRPSVQHGSSSNLSIGSTPLEPESYQNTLPQGSEQLPIGTRPVSSQRPITPKLNPAAPTFKTLFGRGDAKKAAKAEKTAEKRAEEDEKLEFQSGDFNIGGSSPPNPRLSRDAQSIATATSVADSHDSLDHSTSGTPSETVTPSGPKETLMQKITRKSSSSKFNVPWAKERGGIFSKKAGEPSTPGEIDEDPSGEGHLGKSVDSNASTPQQEKGSRSSLSWPNIRRKSKKAGQTAAESAERNSEAGDDDI